MIRLYKLFTIICILESGMNTVAVNMKSGAIGPAQITQGVLDDVNPIHGETWKLHQLRRMDTSFCVFRRYLTRYNRLRKDQGLVTYDEAVSIIRAWRNGPFAEADNYPDYTQRALNLLRR